MSVGVAGAAVTALAESETRNETQQGHLGIGPFRQFATGDFFFVENISLLGRTCDFTC